MPPPRLSNVDCGIAYLLVSVAQEVTPPQLRLAAPTYIEHLVRSTRFAIARDAIDAIETVALGSSHVSREPTIVEWSEVQRAWVLTAGKTSATLGGKFVQPGQSVALHPGQVTFLLLKHHCVTISPPMERIMVQPSALLVAASAAAEAAAAAAAASTQPDEAAAEEGAGEGGAAAEHVDIDDEGVAAPAAAEHVDIDDEGVAAPAAGSALAPADALAPAAAGVPAPATNVLAPASAGALTATGALQMNFPDLIDALVTEHCAAAPGGRFFTLPLLGRLLAAHHPHAPLPRGDDLHRALLRSLNGALDSRYVRVRSNVVPQCVYAPEEGVEGATWWWRRADKGDRAGGGVPASGGGGRGAAGGSDVKGGSAKAVPRSGAGGAATADDGGGDVVRR